MKKSFPNILPRLYLLVGRVSRPNDLRFTGYSQKYANAHHDVTIFGVGVKLQSVLPRGKKIEKTSTWKLISF